MPPRSNSFQRLILLIEASLAPIGARIIESLMLRDLVSGHLREIDIAIDIPSGPRTIRVALECRDHKRPASVQWINELTGKYMHLPVDRIVAVSRSGFTKSARDKAAAVKIDLLTFEDAPNFDWSSLSTAAQFVVVASMRYKWTSITLVPPLPTGAAAPAADPIAALMVYREPSRQVPLADLIHADITKEPCRSILTKTWFNIPDAEARIIQLLPGWYYRDGLGNEQALTHADIILTGGVDLIEFTMRPATYAGVTVAHAEAIVDGQPVSLVVLEREGEEPQWLWYLKDSATYPWRGLHTPTLGFSKGQLPRLLFVHTRGVAT
jgi:restriction endonuclease